VRVWLGRPDAPDLMNGLPEGIEVDAWDGASPPPPSLSETEFYVVPFLPRDDIVLDVIPTLPRLRVVQVPVAGYEDVLGRIGPDVVLCNARGVHDAATAEWVVGAIIAMVREFPEFVREQAAGIRRHRQCHALAGKRVLIVGHGSIGGAVEQRLQGFEVDIVRVARRARPDVLPAEALAEVLPDADVVVVLVPASAATRHLVDAGFLAAMKDGALLVNAARGSLVDQAALEAEVRAGRLRAALDVGEPDPLPPDHPLPRLPGLFYTPHQAGHTVLDVPTAYAFIGEQLRRFARGEPLSNVVHPSIPSLQEA
jgi:phosphoglycerate dehydrogenase-like enzyme